jgi:hypothetical protein
MADQHPGEHLILKSNTLVFYVDESGDEQLNNPQHPIFAFRASHARLTFTSLSRERGRR